MNEYRKKEEQQWVSLWRRVLLHSQCTMHEPYWLEELYYHWKNGMKTTLAVASNDFDSDAKTISYWLYILRSPRHSELGFS